MKVNEKGGDAVHLPFDAAQAALASGAYEAVPVEGERGPDQPAAQMPFPGTDPKDGKEEARDGEVLTNLSPVGVVAAPPPGLPKEPEKPAETVVTAPKADPAPVKVVETVKPAPASKPTA